MTQANVKPKIIECGKVAPLLAKQSAIDLQDGIALVGLIALLGGIAMFSKAAALIVFGLLCLLVVTSMQMQKNAKGSGE